MKKELRVISEGNKKRELVGILANVTYSILFGSGCMG